ncbi:hypothetical protein JHK86_035300 [Glycine max]|nr:hypothetical protein JHK86_035300 [Glycine max]
MLCRELKSSTISSIREPAMPQPTTAKGTQVMTMDKGIHSRSSEALKTQGSPSVSPSSRTKSLGTSICHPRQVACMQEHSAQNPSRTIPWSILQRAHKTQGPPSVSSIDSHHHVSNAYHL